MKRWCGLLLPVLFSTSFLGGYAAPQDRQYVDYFLRLQAAELFRQKSFLLNWSCAYVNQNRLLGVDLCFSCYRSVSVKQARKLLVGIAEEIVDKINNDPSLRERNLLPEPFTLNQIYLKIETDNVFSAQADVETVQTMYLDRGNITYYSYPASTLFYGHVTKYEETLEQARMLLGENVPFSGVPVLPKEEPLPLPEAGPTAAEPQGKPFTQTMEPVEEPPMTPAPDVGLVTLDKENMLEERAEAAPVQEELWEENLLGDALDTVNEVFPDFRNKVTNRQDHITRVMLPGTPFPGIDKVYAPQRLAVEDVPLSQELLKKNEGQNWSVAELPSDGVPLITSRTTEVDHPLLEGASVPYASVAVSSSQLPETVDETESKKSALCWNEDQEFPKHGGENLVRGKTDEFFGLGLVAEANPPDDQAPPVPDLMETSSLPPSSMEEEVSSTSKNDLDENQEIPEKASQGILPSSFGDGVEEDGESEGSEDETPATQKSFSWLLDLLKDSPKETENTGATESVAASEETKGACKGSEPSSASSGDSVEVATAEPANSETGSLFDSLFSWSQGTPKEESSTESMDQASSQEPPQPVVPEPSSASSGENVDVAVAEPADSERGSLFDSLFSWAQGTPKEDSSIESMDQVSSQEPPQPVVPEPSSASSGESVDVAVAEPANSETGSLFDSLFSWAQGTPKEESSTESMDQASSQEPPQPVVPEPSSASSGENVDVAVAEPADSERGSLFDSLFSWAQGTPKEDSSIESMDQVSSQEPPQPVVPEPSSASSGESVDVAVAEPADSERGSLFDSLFSWAQGTPKEDSSIESMDQVSSQEPPQPVVPELSSASSGESVEVAAAEPANSSAESMDQARSQEPPQTVVSELSSAPLDESGRVATAESEKSDSGSFFKRLFRWAQRKPKESSATESTDQAVLKESSLADMYAPSPVNPPNPSEDDTSPKLAMDVLPSTEELSELTLGSSKTEVAIADAPPADTKPAVSGFARWLHIAPRDASPEVEGSQTVATVPGSLEESPQPRLASSSIVPPPELIDETQEEEGLEISSAAPMYQKVVNWLRVSNESLSPESSETVIAEEETNSSDESGDDAAASDESKPWYKRAMALFKGAPRESQEEVIAYVPPAEEELIALEVTASLPPQEPTEPSSSDVSPQEAQSNGLMAQAKSWFFVAPREQQTTAGAQDFVQEGSQDDAKNDSKEMVPLADDEEFSEESASWLERFSDWVHGKEDEEATTNVSDSVEPRTAKEEFSSTDNGTVVATDLGTVDRPDEAWEDIEDEMDDDDADDETTKPGVMTRSLSAIHSLWQSVIGETTDKQKNLDESTASHAAKESSDNSEQPS